MIQSIVVAARKAKLEKNDLVESAKLALILCVLVIVMVALVGLASGDFASRPRILMLLWAPAFLFLPFFLIFLAGKWLERFLSFLEFGNLEDRRLQSRNSQYHRRIRRGGQTNGGV